MAIFVTNISINVEIKLPQKAQHIHRNLCTNLCLLWQKKILYQVLLDQFQKLILVVFFINSPSKAEVVVIEFCLPTPRIIIHKCLASITTATPHRIQGFFDRVQYLCCKSFLHL